MQSGQLPGGPGMAIISMGNFNDTPLGIALDSQRRIIIVGTTDNATATDIVVVRLTPAGALILPLRAGFFSPQRRLRVMVLR